jgi:hypothetical protein
MAVVKMNISLDEQVARTLRRLAADDDKPASRLLAELVVAEEKRRRDELAEEGYRLLAGDNARFAADAWKIALETWPEWEHGTEAEKR